MLLAGTAQAAQIQLAWDAPVSNTDKGSTNYTVRIAVDDMDERLRWGMTAFVNIQVEK